MFGRFVLGISVGRQALFLRKEALLQQMNRSCARQALTFPGSGLVLNVAIVSLLDCRSNYLILKAH